MLKEGSIIDVLSQIVINIIIFVIQVLAPLSSLIFVFLSLFIQTAENILIFNISFGLYVVGLFTSTLAKNYSESRFFKSPFENKHPFLSVLIDLVATFFIPVLITFIFGLIRGDYYLFTQQVLLTYWGLRIINAVYKTK